MDQLLNCPLCGGEKFTTRFTCLDYTVSKEKFPVVECEGCGFVFTNPRPALSTLGKYYKSDTYISHSDTSSGLVNKLYKLVRRFTLKQKYSLTTSFLSPNTLLDIGCGTGAFLNYCKVQGTSVVGIEPDDQTRQYANDTYQIDARPESELKVLTAHHFSVITMWHVLEHVSDLHDRIEDMKRLLTQEGRIFIAVPNHYSHDAQWYGKDWAAYDVPRHLHHFDIHSITKLFRAHAFEVEDVLPMKFDAYYVSMLSEEIRSGKRNFIKGMFRGLISNLKASKTTWSSQIYVIRRQK
jgi:2-polyprenyl-3-methyl-5-hydroxy-6-metoxy-1,4-benzoquinol methylase